MKYIIIFIDLFVLILAFILVCFFLFMKNNNISKKQDSSENDLSKNDLSKNDSGVSLYCRSQILSRYELGAYRRLLSIVGSGVYLSCKVRLWDVLRPVNARDYSLQNKIARKHLDFVYFDFYGNVLCAVELDDSSHRASSRQIADQEKNIILSSVGIHIFRTGFVDDAFLDQLRSFLASSYRF